uniref:Transposase n=1 Tax=Heterorhabditis bacteriophora TaxID=37862 RepID=A0A1I7X4J5_HETBA
MVRTCVYVQLINDHMKKAHRKEGTVSSKQTGRYNHMRKVVRFEAYAANEQLFTVTYCLHVNRVHAACES